MLTEQMLIVRKSVCKAETMPKRVKYDQNVASLS